MGVGWGEINEEHALSYFANLEKLWNQRNQAPLEGVVLGGGKNQKGWWKVCLELGTSVLEQRTQVLIFILQVTRQLLLCLLLLSSPAKIVMYSDTWKRAESGHFAH